MGFKRDDGRVGTRNYIAVVSTVNCSATVVHEIAAYFTKEKLSKTNVNLDSVFAPIQSALNQIIETEKALNNMEHTALSNTAKALLNILTTFDSFSAGVSFTEMNMVDAACSDNSSPQSM